MKRISSFAFFCVLSAHSFASPGQAYLSAFAIDSFSSMQNVRPSFTYYNQLLNDVYSTKRNADAFSLGLAGGYEFKGHGRFPSIALGLALNGDATHRSFTGVLNETPLGDATNSLYNYKFNASSLRIMATTQLTWDVKKFKPFVNAGMGTAWNRFKGYTETPTDTIGFVALPAFAAKSTAQFAYQLGLGVGYAFNKNQGISLGYQYVNLGQLKSNSRGNLYPYHLNFGDLKSNEVYVAYTHYFA